MTQHTLPNRDRYADGARISARRAQKAEILAEALTRLLPECTELELVDFGCADGAVPVLLLGAAFGAAIRRITGITLLDYNDLPKKPAHAHPRFTRVIADLDSDLAGVALPWGQCDAVIATAFFHYLRQPETAFRHAYHLLKPGGYLLAGMPAPWVLAARRNGIPLLHPRNNAIRHIRPLDTWHDIATKCGFVELGRRPVQWLGITATVSFERWLRCRFPWFGSNYLVVYQKPVD